MSTTSLFSEMLQTITERGDASSPSAHAKMHSIL